MNSALLHVLCLFTLVFSEVLWDQSDDWGNTLIPSAFYYTLPYYMKDNATLAAADDFIVPPGLNDFR